jgi:hypothetical protein
MKNLLILIVLISTNMYSQTHIEISKGYYILKSDKSDWEDLIVSDTKFEISTKIIEYSNNGNLESFQIESSDDETHYDNGDLIFRVYATNIQNKDVEIIFMTAVNCDRYIYVLSDNKSITFKIN